MRVLKAALTAAVICAALLTGYLIYGAQAELSGTVETAPAQEHADVFDSVARAVQRGTVAQALTQESLDGAENYTLVSIKVRVKNRGLLPMEWMTCAYEAAPGDIAVYSITELPMDVPARSERTFFVRVIRHNGDVQTGKLVMTYYVAGREITKTLQ